ncbi:MAG: hypothetical protein JXB25_10125, partial [Deltaproteobacteria bacterium]|nr:hypothetical protein [Deltaproteobacteria bacterium]
SAMIFLHELLFQASLPGWIGWNKRTSELNWKFPDGGGSPPFPVLFSNIHLPLLFDRGGQKV